MLDDLQVAHATRHLHGADLPVHQEEIAREPYDGDERGGGHERKAEHGHVGVRCADIHRLGPRMVDRPVREPATAG